MDFSLKLQCLSDLHLEMPKNEKYIPDIKVIGNFVALCGDIGNPFKSNYKEFIKKKSQKFSQVFLVTGNHEFYGNEVLATKIELSKLCDLYSNVHYFDSYTGEIFIDEKCKVKFFGSHLWGDASKCSKKRREDITFGMSDFRMITLNKKMGLLTLNDATEFFQKDISYIKEEIDKGHKGGFTNVILSHNAPIVNDEILSKSELLIHEAYGNNLNDLFGEKIQLWCYGHTHKSYDTFLNGSRIYSNQFGYAVRGEKCGFDKNGVVEVLSKENLKKNFQKRLEIEKKMKKKVKNSKSFLQFCISPSNTSVNFEKLAKKIKKITAKEGIKWGEKVNKRPLAFGLYQLIMVATVDDKIVDVSNDIKILIEEMDEVGSVKIEEWRKWD